ncbi:hypothetical protein ALC57_00054, partial [Trachymyrmex cornetzi]
RIMLCHRCLEPGHIKKQCNSETDRSALCYRCGLSGHIAKGCTEQVFCPVCSAKNVKANHRMGGPACKPPVSKKKINREGPISRDTPQCQEKSENIKIDIVKTGEHLPEKEKVKDREGSVVRQLEKCRVSEGAKSDMDMEVELDVGSLDTQNSPTGTKEEDWPKLGVDWSITGEGDMDRKEQGGGGTQLNVKNG